MAADQGRGGTGTLSAKDDDTSVLSGRSMRAISKANDAQWESNRPAAPEEKDRAPRGEARGTQRSLNLCNASQSRPCLPMSSGSLKSNSMAIVASPLSLAQKSLYFLATRECLTSASRRSSMLSPHSMATSFSTVSWWPLIPREAILSASAERPVTTLPVYFYAFDLLNRDSESLLSWPIERRCQSLDDLLRARKDPLRLSQRLQAPSGHILEAVRKLGLEGVIAKRIGSHYEPGDRSGAWVKHRLNRAQEFVIGGYVPGAHGFDALLVGIYENKHLLFVAKVKNGFVAGLRDKIFSLLERRRVTHCPFKNLPEKKGSRRGESLTAENMKRCRWIKPELVCQVEFVEWTDAGHLRHSTFIAMRDDKEPAEVIRET